MSGMSLTDSLFRESAYRSTPVDRLLGTGVKDRGQDEVVVEEPLEIRVNGAAVAVTMRTPGEDEALAVGFLVTEGIIHSREDVWDVKRCGDPRNPEALNIVEVVIPGILTAENAEDAEKSAEDGFRILGGRQRYASSSCGICGRGSIEAVRRIAAPFDSVPTVSARTILSLPEKLRSAQAVFTRTGGLHAAGLFTVAGELLFHAEDVGRHNTVDKVVGKWLQSDRSDRSDRSDVILMVSGRAGFEIVQKALVARIPAVCSVSAPSSLAVELAVESGMTLVGFVRGETMNVYAGMENVTE